MKKAWLALLLLIGLGLFAMKTFFGPHYFDGHDAQAHIVRLYQFDQALHDGQIPPRWAGGLLAGRGYPVFIFAYPLPYFIAEAFHWSGFSLAVAIKLTFISAYFFSFIGMYFFVLTFWQSTSAAFLAALLWSWAPPIFEKIFIAGALGEVVAFGFIPWTFLALFNLFKNSGLKQAIILSLFLSAWVLSHLLNPIIFSPLLILFSLSQIFKSKSKKLAFQLLLLTGFLTLGLTAWFILPAVLEIKFTHFNEFVKHNYANDFVSFARLLYSKWGTDAPGWGNNPISQQVGVAQWLAVGLVLVFFRKQIWPFISSFAISIFLMLSISQPLWDLPTPMQNVSTPWRFLSLAVFSAAILAGSLMKLIKLPLVRNIVLILLVSLTIYGNRNHLRINESRDYNQDFFDHYTSVATGWNEHLPIWVKDTPHEFPLSQLEVLSGDCQVFPEVIKSNLKQFKLNCNQDSFVQLNTAYYPGWQAQINKKNINLDPGDNGTISLIVPAGEQQLIVKFSNTPLRRNSKLISFFTLLFILLYYFRYRLNHILKILLVHMRIKR